MPKTSSEVAVHDELERAHTAYELRRDGAKWDDVASEVGYENGQTARLMVSRTLKRAALDLSQERLDEMLAQELEDLGLLQEAAWPAAMMGDPKAIDSVLKVKDRVHRLLGFDKRDEKITNQTLIVSADRYVETLQEAIAEREKNS
jgi:hypothetical protein